MYIHIYNPYIHNPCLESKPYISAEYYYFSASKQNMGNNMAIVRPVMLPQQACFRTLHCVDPGCCFWLGKTKLLCDHLWSLSTIASFSISPDLFITNFTDSGVQSNIFCSDCNVKLPEGNLSSKYVLQKTQPFAWSMNRSQNVSCWTPFAHSWKH